MGVACTNFKPHQFENRSETSAQPCTSWEQYAVCKKFVVQSELKGMVGELIYEVKYQISAGPGGP